ncbi:WXG100 family type VII secretion target [Streptomyces griseorubiginosus]|uniref:WXG100 family type VII secretion target n=1 Tax=Streptomyces griseorubiginosus TaxID=67304 RepID=UPI0036E344AF
MGDKDIDDFSYVETNQCISAKSTTQFGLHFNMDQMKDMVRDADPDTVTRVAAAWEALSKDLVGPGGIKEALDAAVEHVLAHWEGQSADMFRQRAQVISTKITDSSKYASHTSVSLRGAAATLAEIKPEVMAMEKPGTVSSALDYIGNMGDRDDSGANNALKSGEGSQAALDGNAGSLSEGREAQLRMAVKMEALGAAYNSRAAEMGSWRKGNVVNDREDYPGDPGGVAPAPVVVPTETPTRSPQRVTASTGRTAHTSTIGSSKAVTPPSGITGGAHKPTVSQPQVGTAIDGISGGRTGAPSVGGGTGTVGGGSAAGGGIGGGAGFVGGAVGGAAGAGAARGGLVGRAGAGASAGGMAGRAGAGGVGGVGAAKGATGRVGGTARGGVVGGTPKSGTGAGRGTSGGSGLHNSRGAAGKGASAVRKGGIAGAPGSRTGRRKEDEQHEGERPDYLIEDEETWTPQTNAAPRVIE